MGQLKTPKEYFGKQPGDDRVMIHWDQLCAYYREADKISDRMIHKPKEKARRQACFFFWHELTKKRSLFFQAFIKFKIFAGVYIRNIVMRLQ